MKVLSFKYIIINNKPIFYSAIFLIALKLEFNRNQVLLYELLLFYMIMT